jgi:hypothetical protein
VQERAGNIEHQSGIHQPRVVQLLGHISPAVTLLYGDLHLGIGLVQRTHVVDQQPTDARQQAGYQHYTGQIDDGPVALGLTAAVTVAALLGGRLPADLLGVPLRRGVFVSFFTVSHKSLLLS